MLAYVLLNATTGANQRVYTLLDSALQGVSGGPPKLRLIRTLPPGSENAPPARSGGSVRMSRVTEERCQRVCLTLGFQLWVLPE